MTTPLSVVHKYALYDGTQKPVGGVVQTAERHNAMIEIDGVQWRSWLPHSTEEAAKINQVADRLIAAAHSASHHP